MAWQQRLREAAITSPSGVRRTFAYEDVTQNIEAKGSPFEFLDADGTFVQRTGVSGRRYPLRMFVSGGDYDLEANAFEAALLESGTFKLEHPIYGTHNVVPFGAITRRDDLKTGGNQTVIEATFWSTIGLIYPTSQKDAASSVLGSISEYNTAAAEAFGSLLEFVGIVDKTTVVNSYIALLGATESVLGPIAATQADVERQFNAITDSINEGIDILIDTPITLGFQTALMIQAPARALTSITARLSAYADLANALISGDGATVPGPSVENSNSFHTRDLYASTYVSGSVVSVVNNQFITKTDALAAAEVILTQLEVVTNWRDDNFQALEQIDTGESYQQLQEAVALAAGFLVEISFNLLQERRIVLDRDRTIVDLAAELYGEVDAKLDFLITSNDLGGDEILELRRGREIVYYV